MPSDHRRFNFATIRPSGTRSAARLRGLLPVVVWMLLLAFITAPLMGTAMPFLPRYAVMVLPLAVLALVDLGASYLPRRALWAALLIATMLSVLNIDGRWYRPDFNSFAVAERSMQYRGYLQVQRQALHALEERPEELPVWHGRADAFMVADPMMGYVAAPPANAFNILSLPYARWHLADYPDHFYLLQTNPWHGGEQIQRTLNEAQASPEWQIQSKRFSAGGFRSALHELRRQRPR